MADKSSHSVQAAATVDTEAGETYLVQIGGPDFFLDGPDDEGSPEYGRLRLAVR